MSQASTFDPWMILALVLGAVSFGLGAYLWFWLQTVDARLDQVQSSLRRHLEKRL